MRKVTCFDVAWIKWFICILTPGIRLHSLFLEYLNQIWVLKRCRHICHLNQAVRCRFTSQPFWRFSGEVVPWKRLRTTLFLWRPIYSLYTSQGTRWMAVTHCRSHCHSICHLPFAWLILRYMTLLIHDILRGHMTQAANWSSGYNMTGPVRSYSVPRSRSRSSVKSFRSVLLKNPKFRPVLGRSSGLQSNSVSVSGVTNALLEDFLGLERLTLSCI